MITLLHVVGGVLALGFGIWLGLPGRYEQTPEDIEQIMASGGGRRRKTRTMFTPLAWVQRKVSARSGRNAHRAGSQRGFRIQSPDDH